MKTLALIEDDPDLYHLVRYNLEGGFSPSGSTDVHGGTLFPKKAIDVCVLRATSKTKRHSVRGIGSMLSSRLDATSVVRQADCNLWRAARPRLTLSRMSDALAVQIKGLGS